MNGFSSRELQIQEEGFRRIAGVDEAGRGPLAGPVVAAAVLFTPDVRIAGMNDSKQLSERKRECLFDEIHRKASAIGIGILSPSEIDELNILRATIAAMRDAVSRIDPAPDFILVDGNRFIHPSIPFRCVVRGDSLCFSIAAASVIAKVTRDRLMVALDERYPGYDLARNKGYPTRRHIDALRRYGPSDIHRRSFVVKELATNLSTPCP